MRSTIVFFAVAILLTSFGPARAQVTKRPTTTTNTAAATAARMRAARPSTVVHERELHRLHELRTGAAEYAATDAWGKTGIELGAPASRKRGHLLRAEATAERYVYWHESAHMAILAGDIVHAWATIEEIERHYAISAYELKAAALEAAAAKKEPLTEPKKFAQAAFLAFEESKIFDPDSAGRLLAFAQTTAQQAQDSSMIELAALRSRRTSSARAAISTTARRPSRMSPSRRTIRPSISRRAAISASLAATGSPGCRCLPRGATTNCNRWLEATSNDPPIPPPGCRSAIRGSGSRRQ